MRESLDGSALKGLRLAVASSCDLRYFVNSVRQEGIFEEVSYNFELGTSDDASIEMMRDGSILTGADVIVASVAETSKKVVYPLVNGRVDADIETIFAGFEDVVLRLFNYLEASDARVCFVFKYPFKRGVLDINDRPWVQGSISYWLDRLDGVYERLLSSGRYTKIDLLDATEALEAVGFTDRMFRNEFHGGHLEGPGSHRLASIFWERLISRVDLAGKVKAIALDLDNTLWDGVFLESETPPRFFANRVVALTQHSQKGIPVCVVSKNNPEDTDRIRELIRTSAPALSKNIVEYYVGWGPKSESIRKMATDLAIDPSSIALFDDSEFERGEVKFAVPEVRVYTDQDVETSLRFAEFSFTRLSGDARRRVQSYKENLERGKSDEQMASTSLDAYLDSLGFKISFSNAGEGDLDRVDELVQRTNQQNLLLNRTPRNDLARMISDRRCITIALEDKFGEYGTIGTIAYNIADGDIELVELAVSCRALGKGVEECIIAFIDSHFADHSQVRFTAKRTYRNEAFFAKLIESGFEFHESNSKLTLDVTGRRDFPAWFTVNDSTHSVAS